MNIFNPEDNGYICYVPKIVDPNSKMKKNISPGERATLGYLHFMIYQTKYIEQGDILVIDGEGALCTEIVREFLSRHDVHPFVLPSVVHQLLNPCDNTFHSLFKQSYYREISNMNDGNISLDEKFNIAMQCFHAITNETVQGMFARCGLIPSGKDKRALVSNLICEGITSLEKHNQYHKKCLLSFLEWVRANDLRSNLCPHSIEI